MTTIAAGGERGGTTSGLVSGVGAGALWGIVFVAPRVLPEYSPVAFSAGRYLLYGLLSLALALPRLRALWQKTTRRDWLVLFALSLPGNILYYLCVANGVQRAGVAPISLIVGLLPVTVTFVGSLEHGSVPMRRLALPLLMASAGVACIYFDERRGAGSALGLLFGAGALACWTLYAVMNARYLRAHPRFTSQEWSLLTGLATGALSLFLAVPAFHDGAPPPKFWALSVAVALGASVIGNRLWNNASRKLPLTLSGQVIVFETVSALVYGFAFEARWPKALELLATALLLGGVAISAQRHAEPRRSA